MEEYSYLKLENIAKNISAISWIILTYLSKKEYVNANELREISKCNDVRLFTELRILETLDLLERKNESSNARKKVYYITMYGDYILKYKSDED